MEELNAAVDELLGIRHKLEEASEAGSDLRPALIELNNQLVRVQRKAEVLYRQTVERAFGSAPKWNGGNGQQRHHSMAAGNSR